jgi:magnesium-transporting ATPase (P-type)
VHGQLSYERIARAVAYFFYKNIIFVMSMFWFQLFNGFSGQARTLLPSSTALR